MKLTDDQIERWRALRDQHRADPARASDAERQARRAEIRSQVLGLIQSFRAQRVALEEFRATIDAKSRGPWDAFGLKDASGAPVLNQVVLDAPDPRRAATELRDAVAAPADEPEARRRMTAFEGFVREQINTNHNAKRPVQLGRIGHFVSAFWHVQDADRWPIAYGSACEALQRAGLLNPTHDVVTDYFAFRDACLSLRSALGLDPWEAEQLLDLAGRRGLPAAGVKAAPAPAAAAAAVPAAATVPAPATVEPEPANARPEPAPVRPEPAAAVTAELVSATHETTPAGPEPTVEPIPAGPADRVSGPQDQRPVSDSVEVPVEQTADDRGGDTADQAQVQGLLAQLGKAFGCKVWIAAGGHDRPFGGQRLGDLSIPALPTLGVGSASQRLISLIDVVWLKGANQIVAAFEVAGPGSFHAPLLRVADLTVLSPNLLFPLYVVAPEPRLAELRHELSRASLQTLQLHKRCGFFSAESLAREAEHMRRWATDPAVIDKLAERLPDAPAEGLNEGGV